LTVEKTPSSVGWGEVRLVATDLDGTIVRPDGTVSPRTVAALAAVEASGRHLVLVTGRPPRWMAPVVEATGHRGVAICGNGAFIYDLHTERILESFLLDPAAALEVVHRLRVLMPDVHFAFEALDVFAREPGYNAHWPMPDQHAVAPAVELIDRPVAKLLARDDTSLGDAMLALATPALNGLATVTHSNPQDGLLEISAPGVSKASTLARLCAELGVDRADVVAFGDQPNDLPMLAFAGTSYAVANAHPDVLTAVSNHTGSVDDDGVAQVLEQLLRVDS
jgi:Cof subfamily protein (haloacid dehalogenase superfamily)